MATFFFCGIGGIGMSAIALYLKKTGHTVIGSDRSFDQNRNTYIKNSLIKEGIHLFKQDGSGVTKDIDIFIVSSAIEDSILDVQKAKTLHLSIRKRSQVLADIFHSHAKNIAIAGTSGKTTVTAMVGHILHQTGNDPTMINGGIGINRYNGTENSNLICGKSDICVIEADESDGSIELYNPFISVVTNISLDHKPLEEIRILFENFLNRTKKGIVLNADCPEMQALSLTHSNIISFSVHEKTNATLCAKKITFGPKDVTFDLNGKTFTLPFIGLHNLENALAAIGICLHMEISIDESIQALNSFAGTKRRLEFVGSVHDIQVIDDYAHNVEKIKATLTALQNYQGRIFAIYQPHGFAPLKLMKNNLIDMLIKQLDNRTIWIMPNVFYAGGTVQRTISSKDIVMPLQNAGKKAFYFESRELITSFLLPKLQKNDRIVVMGARDDTLSDFALNIIERIKEKKCL